MSDEENASESESQPEAVYRDLKNPYWEIRPADRPNESYLSGEAYKIVQNELNCVLPAVKVDNLGDYQSRVTYELEPAALASLRDLDSIPPSQLEAFRVAATKFYDRATEDQVSDYEALLRLSFRLPDPLKDPDAYRVYGEDFERILVVLWGCEASKGGAIAMVAHPRVPGSEKKNVYDHLKGNSLGWQQMQQDALTLLATSNEPFARFVGVPIYDNQKKLASVSVRNTRREGKNFRPLRKIMWDEHAAFQKAARDFYARSDKARSPYEGELRKRFRLPDPAEKPEFYLNYGSKVKPKLMCLVPPDLQEEEALCLTIDNQRGIPPRPEGEEPPPEPETDEEWLEEEKKDETPTVASRLRKWTKTLKHFARDVGIVCGILAVLLGAFYWSLDKTPPVLSVKSRDVNTLLLLANKPIELPEGNAIAVKLTDGTLMDLKITQNNPTNINLALEQSLTDTQQVVVVVTGISDQVRFHRNTTSTNIAYTYTDQAPPDIENVAGDGKNTDRILITFSEPVDKASASVRTNYVVPGFRTSLATLKTETMVELRVEPDGGEFEPSKTYSVTCINVADRSQAANAIPAPGVKYTFTFKDDDPPKLIEVPSTTDMFQVRLGFDERLVKANAIKTNNYTITGTNAPSIPVYQVEWKTNEVVLTAGPLLGTNLVTVSGDVIDMAKNSITTNGNSMGFTSRALLPALPTAQQPTINNDGQTITVEFSAPIRPEADFRVIYNNNTGVADNTMSFRLDARPEPVPDQVVPATTKYEIGMEKGLAEGNYLVVVSKIRDLAGRAIPDARLRLDYYDETVEVGIREAKFTAHDELEIQFWDKLAGDSIRKANVVLPGFEVSSVKELTGPDTDKFTKVRVTGKLTKPYAKNEVRVLNVRNIRRVNSFVNHSPKYPVKQ